MKVVFYKYGIYFHEVVCKYIIIFIPRDEIKYRSYRKSVYYIFYVILILRFFKMCLLAKFCQKVVRQENSENTENTFFCSEKKLQ